MKKRVFAISLLILAVVLGICMLSGCTRVKENMLTTNGDGNFTYSDIDKLGNDFILSTSSSITDLATVFAMDQSQNKEEASSYNLTVTTTNAGYAYVAQKVRVTAGCYYAINYSVKLSSFTNFDSNKAADGIYASILEDNDLDESFIKKGMIGTTSTNFNDVQMTFRAKSSGYATIAIKFGSEDAPAKITAVLNSFSVCRIPASEVEDGTYVGKFISDYYGEVTNFNIFYIVMGGVAIVVLCFAGYVMLRRNYALSDPESPDGYKNRFPLALLDSTKMNILLIVGIGLFIRILASVLGTVFASGHDIAKTFLGYNVQGAATQALFIAKYGPQYLLQSSGAAFATDAGYTVMGVSSSPLQLYFLGFCGLFGRIFESSNAYLATIFFIRFFTSVAEVVTAVIIYDILKKYAGQIGATVIAVMYLALPVIFATSSLWGYTESLTALFIVLTIKFMLDNEYIGTAVSFFVAFMFSQSALFFAPFVLFYTVLVCIRDVKMGEYKNLIAACSILVLSFFVYYALSVPFALNSIQKGKAFYWFTYAWNELYTDSLYTINAFNFQAMLGNNLVEVTTSSLVVTIIFIVFMLTLTAISYFKSKNRLNLILLATAFINMMFVFGNGMNPMSMYISLAMMLIYAIINKEKRIFFSFIVFALLMYINVSYYELMLSYTATSVPYWTGKNALMYVIASLEIIFALYYIYIVYDIVVSRKVKKIAPLSMQFIPSFINFFRRIKSNTYRLIGKLQKNQ